MPNDVFAGKPSPYEKGKTNAQGGRAASELPYDPNSPDADEYRRGYKDGAAIADKERMARDTADALKDAKKPEIADAP